MNFRVGMVGNNDLKMLQTNINFIGAKHTRISVYKAFKAIKTK